MKFTQIQQKLLSHWHYSMALFCETYAPVREAMLMLTQGD